MFLTGQGANEIFDRPEFCHTVNGVLGNDVIMFVDVTGYRLMVNRTLFSFNSIFVLGLIRGSVISSSHTSIDTIIQDCETCPAFNLFLQISEETLVLSSMTS